ncbi:MAG: retropepsin-like aspartic protease family protein [Alphaproteobacteria bacterium]
MKRSGGGWLFWGLMAAIVAAVALLIADRDGVILGLTDFQFGEVAFLVLILLWVSSALAGRAMHPGQMARAIVFWSLLGGLLVAGYTYRDELAGVGGRILGALAPGIPVSTRGFDQLDSESIVVTRGRGGHFAIWGEAEGSSVSFLVDTGASFVTLTAREAGRIGINTTTLRYSLPIRTANGVMQAAPITLDRLSIGTIERENVRALVAPPHTLTQSLLGLSFLDTLSSYTVAGDQLILTP